MRGVTEALDAGAQPGLGSSGSGTRGKQQSKSFPFLLSDLLLQRCTLRQNTDMRLFVRCCWSAASMAMSKQRLFEFVEEEKKLIFSFFVERMDSASFRLQRRFARSSQSPSQRR